MIKFNGHGIRGMLRVSTFSSSNQMGRQPRPAPPHSPAQASASDASQAKFLAGRLILTSGEDVGDHQVATGTQHTDGFRDGPATGFFSFDVVHRNIGNDEIESVVLKW